MVHRHSKHHRYCRFRSVWLGQVNNNHYHWQHLDWPR
ncbi:hypothetical protein FOCG_18470 [Fusarium oxysporum f. sp. radicis-lycopersici 26381]|nr:hypothetical protein FOCG_18470 [Fusarium oxysporum f. sp. radicis-lycopersici 26381]